jgi:hypothetical protein
VSQQDDFGFVANDEPVDFGFVEDEPEPDPVIHADPGYSAPDPAPQQSARHLTLPEVSYQVDPRGRRPDIVTEGTEGRVDIREAAPAPPPPQVPAQPPQPAVRQTDMQRFMRDFGTQGPHVALGNAVGRMDADAFAGGIPSGLYSAGEDERAGVANVPAGPLARLARALTPESAQAAVRSSGLGANARALLRRLPGGEAVAQYAGGEGDLGDVYRSGRDSVRASQAERRERAPISFGAGEIAGQAPTALVPGPQSTALARIGTQAAVGGGLGFLRGAGESEAEDVQGVARDALAQGGTDAVVGGVLAGGGELGSGMLRRLGGWASRQAPAVERQAVQSRLEASGVWGGAPMRAAEEMPGGQRALAADMRRLGIGHGVGDPGRLAAARETGEPLARARLPRSTRAADDAAQVMHDAGGRMDDVLGRMDEAAAPAVDRDLSIAGIDREPFRDIAPIRRAFEGLSPEEATRVATGQRPPVAGGQSWEPIQVYDQRAHVQANGGSQQQNVVVADGFHRLRAAREAGATHILANVRQFGPDGQVIGEVQRIVPISSLGEGYRQPAVRGMVDLGRVADEMEAVARELERLPIGGRQSGQSLRQQVVDPLREAGAVDFRTAHQQRQHLDRMIRSWANDPNLATVAGRLQTARRAVSRAMDEAAEGVDPALRSAWRQANRDYSVGAFADEYGRGAERLSVGGGMGGAVGTGVELAMAGNPLASIPASLANRVMAQEQRMAFPGLRAATLEGLAPRLQAMGPRAQQWAATLRAAQQRGQQSLAAAHYALSRQDPAYRQAVEAAQSQEQETPSDAY